MRCKTDKLIKTCFYEIFIVRILKEMGFIERLDNLEQTGTSVEYW
jgi:hypothetical protein